MLLKNQWPESFPAKDPGTGHHRHSAPGVKNHHVSRVKTMAGEIHDVFRGGYYDL